MSRAESPLLRYQHELDVIDAAIDELAELNSLDMLTAQQLLRRQELIAKLWAYNAALRVSENWVPASRSKKYTESVGEYFEHLMLIVGCVLMFGFLWWVLNETLKLFISWLPNFNIIP